MRPADGNVAAQVDGNQKATTYDYDAHGRLRFQADPLGRRTDFTYYPGGQLKTKQDPGGNCSAVPATGCTAWSYNDADQPLTTIYSDGTTPNITGTVYNATGRRIQVQRLVAGVTKTASYRWDSLGRMTSSTDEAGATVAYEYNLRSLPTKTTYPGSSTKTVTRTWDDAGRAKAVQDWLSHTTTYTPDEDSHIVAATTPVGTLNQVDTYAWDNNGELASSTSTETVVRLRAAQAAYFCDGVLLQLGNARGEFTVENIRKKPPELDYAAFVIRPVGPPHDGMHHVEKAVFEAVVAAPVTGGNVVDILGTAVESSTICGLRQRLADLSLVWRRNLIPAIVFTLSGCMVKGYRTPLGSLSSPTYALRVPSNGLRSSRRVMVPSRRASSPWCSPSTLNGCCGGVTPF